MKKKKKKKGFCCPGIKNKVSLCFTATSVWKMRRGKRRGWRTGGRREGRCARRMTDSCGDRPVSLRRLRAESTGKFLIALICYIQQTLLSLSSTFYQAPWARIDFFIFLPGIRRQRVRERRWMENFPQIAAILQLIASCRLWFQMMSSTPRLLQPIN